MIKKQEKEARKLESRSHRSRRDHRDRSRSRDRRDRSWSRERSRSPDRERRRRSDVGAADDLSTRRDDRHHRRGHELDEPLQSRRETSEYRRPRSPTPERQRPIDDGRIHPDRRQFQWRNHDRKAEDYDFEAERARDRQRWERHHDRERGLKEGDGWGKGGEGRPHQGGW